jgi:hypothetical protein
VTGYELDDQILLWRSSQKERVFSAGERSEMNKILTEKMGGDHLEDIDMDGRISHKTEYKVTLRFPNKKTGKFVSTKLNAIFSDGFKKVKLSLCLTN